MLPYNKDLVAFNWWDADVDEGERHRAAFLAISSLYASQSGRIMAGRRYEATYEQQNLFGGDNMVGYGGQTIMGMQFGGENPLLTFNAMQIGFDTLCSKLEQANGQVLFQTDGGSWEQQQKALQLKKLVAGEFYRLKFYEVKAMAVLDMLLHGTGYIKFFCDPITHKPSMMRWHPSDVFFDEVEARDLHPLTMYTKMRGSKRVLKKIFPKFAKEIESATCLDMESQPKTGGLDPSDAVDIVECWRLPSGEGTGDGKRLLCLSTVDLECDDWTRMEFPFARIDWVKRRRGPYSIPAAEQVIHLQSFLNKLVQREQDCLYMLSAPYILTDEASMVDPAQFESSGVGNFITFTGPNPPTVITNKVVPDDIRLSKQELVQNIYAILGINGLESTGQKPGGLDTAPALASYMDQSSLRHVKTLKENERFTLRCAEQLLSLMREIKEEYGEYAAFGEATHEVEMIKFSEADLPPDSYVMKMALANLLPDSPAGRVQRVGEMAATGAFTPIEIVKMYNSPDINAAVGDKLTSEEDIDWTIMMLSKPEAEFIPPEASQDLTAGVAKVNSAYLKAKRQGAPDIVLEKLSMWRDAATQILQDQQDAQMQQQMQMQAQALQQQMGTEVEADNAKAQGKAQAETAGKIEQMKAQSAIDIHEAAILPQSKPKS